MSGNCRTALRHGVPKRSGFDDLSVSGAMQRIAVYTTIYPGVEVYLPDWYRSVQAQTDQDFQLWIGLDGIEASSVETAIGAHLEAVWVPSEPGNTPARIRQRSLAQIVEDFDAVVLVDSDDILHPTRVAAARATLQTSELAACALRLVDQHRQDLGTTFTLPGEPLLIIFCRGIMCLGFPIRLIGRSYFGGVCRFPRTSSWLTGFWLPRLG